MGGRIAASNLNVYGIRTRFSFRVSNEDAEGIMKMCAIEGFKADVLIGKAIHAFLEKNGYIYSGSKGNG